MTDHLYRLLTIFLVSACLFAVTGILVQVLPGGRDLFERLQPISSQRLTASAPMLIEDNPISTLVTGQLLLKTVFPHDYIPSGYSLSHIMSRVDEAVRPLQEELTPREFSFYQLHKLCEEIGWSTDPTSSDFIVIRTRISAGYDLLHMNHLEAGDVVQSELIDIQILDFNSSNYPYPAPDLEPDEIRKISNFVHADLPQHPQIQVLLKKASENASRFLFAGGGRYE